MQDNFHPPPHQSSVIIIIIIIISCPLLFAGSHNSGTYEVYKEWGVSPDADQSVKNLSNIPLIGTMALDIIHRWSRCQSLTVLQQLRAGVRYLDLRVAHLAATDELRLVHGLYGPTVATCVEQVRAFLDEHGAEVVLLDFNHFYDMELEHHLQAITYLIHVFDGLLCPRSALGALTLGSLRRSGKRVVVFYHHSSVMDFPELWPPKPALHSAWAETMDVGKCLAFQEEAARDRHAQERFHVCQAVLTPDTTSVVQKFASSVEKECARKINEALPAWLDSGGPVLKGCASPSLVLVVDFVEEGGGVVPGIVRLNK